MCVPNLKAPSNTALISSYHRSRLSGLLVRSEDQGNLEFKDGNDYQGHQNCQGYQDDQDNQ